MAPMPAPTSDVRRRTGNPSVVAIVDSVDGQKAVRCLRAANILEICERRFQIFHV
jgi:hypothetical protein